MEKVLENKKPICGHIVKTYDGTKLPCLRPQGHENGHNPFSDTPPLTGKTTAK